MDRAWHFVHGGDAQGPVSGEGLIALALQGVVTESTLVWAGGEQWQPLREVPELVEALRLAEKAEPGAAAVRPLPGELRKEPVCLAVAAHCCQCVHATAASLVLHSCPNPVPPCSRQAPAAGRCARWPAAT